MRDNLDNILKDMEFRIRDLRNENKQHFNLGVNYAFSLELEKLKVRLENIKNEYNYDRQGIH